MKIIRGQHNLKPEHRHTVATIGNFDGVHLGHQKIIQRVVESAKQLQVKSTVICPEPLPREFFLGEKAPARLTPFRDKFTEISKLGVDQFLCLYFNQKMSDMTATDFIQDILVKGLQVNLLKVGDDFQFGHQREGNFEMLLQMGIKHGFEVLNTSTLRDNDDRISSTLIRQALNDDDLDRVEELLGRPYSMGGRVIHGEKRGRQLGFPTANVSVARRISPVRGVYAVEVCGITDHSLPAVANIGTRPTVGGTGFLVEAHLFDFDGDLYGKRIEVVLRHKIRDEKKFDSLDELVKQITHDKQTAQAYFGIQTA